VAAVEVGFVLLDARGEIEASIPIERGRGYRMNDAKVDPAGRFWAGMLHSEFVPGEGSLYRLDPDGRVSVMLTGLALPNGMGWSVDGQRMYFIDSTTHQVELFDFDVQSGDVSNRRHFLVFPQSWGCRMG
jgi:sugar lactone lactonase YvrE